MNLETTHQFSHFSIFAIVGGILFAAQLLLVLLGFSHDNDFIDEGYFHFKWLSKQAVMVFFLMFGLTGLSCTKEFALSSTTAYVIATFVGALTVFLNGLLFNSAKKLQSSGHVFSIEATMGMEATVYQRIPKEGVGKITVSIQQQTFELGATSLNSEEIESFTPVKIVKKLDDHTVVVSAL